jgi:NAD(P)-dependent dehydrogenase (short-subunit alcohol dehydrogenase family)
MAGKVHWSSVLDMELAQWSEAVLSFPTVGMLTTKHGAKAMIAGGRKGSIIHLLSTAAHFGEASGGAYRAAKAALLNLARSAAMDLAHAGIRVNTITPCAMEHQLWTNMREEVFDPNFTPPQRWSFYSRDDYLKMMSPPSDRGRSSIARRRRSAGRTRASPCCGASFGASSRRSAPAGRPKRGAGSRNHRNCRIRCRSRRARERSLTRTLDVSASHGGAVASLRAFTPALKAGYGPA